MENTQFMYIINIYIWKLSTKYVLCISYWYLNCVRCTIHKLLESIFLKYIMGICLNLQSYSVQGFLWLMTNGIENIYVLLVHKKVQKLDAILEYLNKNTYSRIVLYFQKIVTVQIMQVQGKGFCYHLKLVCFTKFDNLYIEEYLHVILLWKILDKFLYL